MIPEPAKRATIRTVGAALIVSAVSLSVSAQDRLSQMPGYEDYARVQKDLASIRPLLISGAVTLGAGDAGGPVWSADATGVDVTWNRKRLHFDLGTKAMTEIPMSPAAATSSPGAIAAPAPASSPCRLAVQPNVPAVVVPSPDRTLHAISRNRNVFIGDAACATLTPITSDGGETSRLRYGSTPWVYGEELDQTTAMWWNKAGTKLAYYRFDETKVPDFYIVRDQTKLQTTLAVEAYPKAGAPNPIPDLFVYDLGTKRTTRIDVRDGQPFTNLVMGHYVYAIEWSPDDQELFVSRKTRRQDVVQFAACLARTGLCRVILQEEWSTGWAGDERSSMRYLNDRTRFLWTSERNGFKNYYLYDLTGKLITPITQHQFEVAGIVRVDEAANTLWYLARDGDNFMKLQLHRVGLDGKGDRRLTDPAFHHQVEVSPNGTHFIDVAQTHDRPPFSQVVEVGSGKPVGQLAESDYSKLDPLGFRRVELFSFAAADGQPLFGSIGFPPNFDPAKRYPVLMAVYGGPAAPGAPAETFTIPTALTTSFGFLSVAVHTRATPGMGKRTLDALYLKLGQTEIDDMAAGVRSLWNRPYFDKDRVGILGISYGGYSSIMALLRHPDVFAAALAMSPPTDWRNYDTIYTERYMRLPEENKEGYDKGSALSYVNNLKGDLLIYFGTADDNVHSNNAMQLIKALQAAGKHFEVQVGPDQGHTDLDFGRAMEFLIEHLVVKRLHAA